MQSGIRVVVVVWLVGDTDLAGTLASHIYLVSSYGNKQGVVCRRDSNKHIWISKESTFL